MRAEKVRRLENQDWRKIGGPAGSVGSRIEVTYRLLGYDAEGVATSPKDAPRCRGVRRWSAANVKFSDKNATIFTYS